MKSHSLFVLVCFDVRLDNGLASHTHAHSSAITEEKRRAENKLSTIEEELEEEQSNSEAAMEKVRKAQQQVDNLTGEVSSLQSSLHSSESTRTMLEKQVKELKDRLEEAANAGGRKLKAQMQAMESRMAGLEEELDMAQK